MEQAGEQPVSPTFFAVSPTPAGWDADRVASFYREYNGHMLRNLAVHEAMPGHVLQLAHAGRYRGATRVRSAFTSGPFVEGWAVYAEELVAGAGLGLSAQDDAALRLHYVGYRAIHDIAGGLAASRPGWSPRQVHDEMLAHGSPPPRHLRTLLNLDQT